MELDSLSYFRAGGLATEPGSRDFASHRDQRIGPQAFSGVLGWLLEFFGYSPYQAWEHGRSWRKGATYLVFMQTEERFQEPKYHRRRVGLDHLAFQADSQAQVDELTTQLRMRGVPILYDPASTVG